MTGLTLDLLKEARDKINSLTPAPRIIYCRNVEYSGEVIHVLRPKELGQKFIYPEAVLILPYPEYIGV